MPNYTILVIDYEPHSGDRVRDALEDSGFDVQVATDGPSGIAAFHRLEPAMTLIEVMLPKKAGLEVCLELKKTDHGEKSIIMMMTSRFRSRRYRSLALHHYKADAYLEKPVSAKALAEAVDALVEQRRRNPFLFNR